MRLDSRTAQIEKKLDGLVALLAQPENARASSTMRDGVQSRQSPHLTSQSPHEMEQKEILSARTPANEESRENGDATADPHRDCSPPTQHHCVPRESYERGYRYPAEQPEMPSMNNPAPEIVTVDERPSTDRSTKDLEDTRHAESLLNDFRAMSGYFPFVVLLPGVAVQTLRSEKPMLFLAILVTASGGDRSLQITLEEQYRHELATKTIIDAQRSLDCLQSILVYLAW